MQVIEPKTKGYVEYLDKEMTIMGILSAFSAVVAAGAIDRTAGADAGAALGTVWQHSAPLVVAGAASALVGGFLFYLQRSLLAWYYGQIVLAEARGRTELSAELLDEADAWDTWVRYQLAFVALYVAFAFLGFALVRHVLPEFRDLVRQRQIILPVIAVATVYGTLLRYVLRKYSYTDDHPWIVLWRRLKSSAQK